MEAHTTRGEAPDRELTQNRQPARSDFRGLATLQGTVGGIKQYAASYAFTEESGRCAVELAAVLQSEDRDRARKDFIDAANAEILRVVEHMLGDVAVPMVAHRLNGVLVALLLP